jgi:hypothetical protein
MTNPENSHVKVIKTEYVGADAAKKQLTPHQQELVEAIQSFSSWDDLKISSFVWRIIAPITTLKGSGLNLYA